jgi:adenosylcobinamide-phosphate synthase
MSFFSILIALLLEQARPLAAHNPIHRGVRLWTDGVARALDAGEQRQAWVTWSVMMAVPALLALLIHGVLEHSLGWVLAVVWNIALLYVTLGFRHFSHHFTEIRDALEAGDESAAREMLARWQHVQVGQIPRSEIVRHVIEYSVIAAHRHVFGVFFWYAALSVFGLGPVGAVVYRLAEHVQRRWQRPDSDDEAVSPVLGRVAAQAWTVIDWLPARATALGFAIVGSFEDAMDGWRHHAQQFPDDNDGVILAATAGAIDLRLGGAQLAPGSSELDLDELQAPASGGSSTPGRAPDVAHFPQVVGLVWRTVVVWLVMVALLTMANLLG